MSQPANTWKLWTLQAERMLGERRKPSEKRSYPPMDNHIPNKKKRLG